MKLKTKVLNGYNDSEKLPTHHLAPSLNSFY